MTEAQDTTETATSFKRRLVGRVASDKMSKTVVVEVTRYKMEPLYRKYVKVRKRYKAHDQNNTYKVGDMPLVIPHWRHI